MTASHIAIAAPGEPGRRPRRTLPASRPRTYNRIRTRMVHARRYSCQGQARLAAGVSRSIISRLLRTASCCVLAGCRGCMPEETYDDEDNLWPGD